MAPFKSTGGFSVGKLLGVFRNRDLTLNSSVRTNRRIPFTATGGTILNPGNGYTYHFFTNSASPETFTVTFGGRADILVIGGGGAGGGRLSGDSGGGGGGAGGFVEVTEQNIDSGSYTVTVGEGGAGYPSNSENGSPSWFSGSHGSYSEVAFPSPIRAEGGGGGGGWLRAGFPGGSGGGGGETPAASTTGGDADKVAGTPTAATPGQGYPGGTGGPYTPGAGGGGGGAGGAGQPGASPSTGGNGGIGRAAFSGDTGIPSSYGEAHPSLPGRWFAGGGGGGDYQGENSGGTGGIGGGGDKVPNTLGGQPGAPAPARAGTNTGGGGGAQTGTSPTSSPTSLSAPGGPGIVIIRYIP